MKKSIDVAAAAIVRNGRYLITQRMAKAVFPGLWEFPGGKVEARESVGDALRRELEEELGVQIEDSEPLMAVEHDYGDKQVRLDVHRVTRWQGEPRGQEGQPLAWQFPTDLSLWPFPAANTSILARLCDD